MVLYNKPKRYHPYFFKPREILRYVEGAGSIVEQWVRSGLPENMDVFEVAACIGGAVTEAGGGEYKLTRQLTLDILNAIKERLNSEKPPSKEAFRGQVRQIVGRLCGGQPAPWGGTGNSGKGQGRSVMIAHSGR
jgi:hypothetical protein